MIPKLALVFFLTPALPHNLSELIGGILIGLIIGDMYGPTQTDLN